MNSEFKLALQLTMVDMMSDGLKLARRNILSMGDASKQVVKDFDAMERHLTRGLKSLAAAKYLENKLKPGVAAAADMQESMDKVEMNLIRSTENAKGLHDQMKAIKETAIFVGANAPFTAKDVIDIEAQLLKSGINLKEVTGKSGVAWSAASLSALSEMAPSEVGTQLARTGQTFGLKSGNDYKQVADWLEKAESSAGHDLGQLFYGLKMSGASAKSLGISPQQLVTMLTMAAPLGEMAGTSVNRFVDRLAGGHREERKYLKYMGLDFFDGKGKFKGIDHAIDEVRTKFKAISNDKNKLILFEKIFGEEGKRFAQMVADGDRNLKQWESFIASHKGLDEKMGIWAQGYNASWIKLITTVKSTGASIFDPWLAPLTEINDKLNAAVTKVGEFAEKHPKTTDTFNGVFAAVAAGAGGYGVWNLFKAGGYGRKVLSQTGLRKLLGGLGSTGVGVAEGKLLQQSMGVTPVYVVNMPGGTFPGRNDAAPEKMPDLVKKPPVMPIPPGGTSLLTKSGLAGLSAIPAYLMGTYLERLTGGSGEFNADMHPDNWGRGWTPWSKEAPKNDIKIDLHIDADGRTIARTNDLNTNAQVGIRRGKFFEGMMVSH